MTQSSAVVSIFLDPSCIPAALDQSLKGHVVLKQIPYPVEKVQLTLRGTIKTPNAWDGQGVAWKEIELLKQIIPLHPTLESTGPLCESSNAITLPFTFLFPTGVALPPSLTFPDSLGHSAYTLSCELFRKKGFRSIKKTEHGAEKEFSVVQGQSALQTYIDMDRRECLQAVGESGLTLKLRYPPVMAPNHKLPDFKFEYSGGGLQIQKINAVITQSSHYHMMDMECFKKTTFNLRCALMEPVALSPELDVQCARVQEIQTTGLDSTMDIKLVVEKKHDLKVEVHVLLYDGSVEKVHYKLPMQIFAPPARQKAFSNARSSSFRSPGVSSDPRLATPASSTKRPSLSSAFPDIRNGGSVSSYPLMESSMTTDCTRFPSPPYSLTSAPKGTPPARPPRSPSQELFPRSSPEVTAHKMQYSPPPSGPLPSIPPYITAFDVHNAHRRLRTDSASSIGSTLDSRSTTRGRQSTAASSLSSFPSPEPLERSNYESRLKNFAPKSIGLLQSEVTISEAARQYSGSSDSLRDSPDVEWRKLITEVGFERDAQAGLEELYIKDRF